MIYIALLRGVNVGKSKWIDMKKLKTVFEIIGYSNVSTYINSGNIIFDSDDDKRPFHIEIHDALREEFGLDVPTLVLSADRMKKIAKAIPDEWRNDDVMKTDVAYLFKEADSRKILDALPVNKEYVDIRYVKGAVIWNVDRNNYNKSRLNKIAGHELYQRMTVRNVNTARFLGGF